MIRINQRQKNRKFVVVDIGALFIAETSTGARNVWVKTGPDHACLFRDTSVDIKLTHRFEPSDLVSLVTNVEVTF